MKRNNYKLVDRFILNEVSRPSVWYMLKINGKSFSILNIGEMMKTAPYKYDGFQGHESLDNKSNIIRADTMENLILKLLKEDTNS